MLDPLDIKILKEIQANGRLSWTELGQKLGLSSPSISERVKRLEQNGVLKGFIAVVDPKKIGLKMEAFIQVELDKPLSKSEFVREIQNIPWIRECYNVAGEGGYLLKVVCRDIEDLDHLVSQTLKEIPGVVKTVTTVILSYLKREMGYPVPEES